MQWRWGDWVQYAPGGDGLMFTTMSELMSSQTQDQQSVEGMTMTTQGNNQEQEVVPGTDGKTFPIIWCYECNQYGQTKSLFVCFCFSI